MTEQHFYNQAPDNGDAARTAEIKRYSEEKQAGPTAEADHRQAVMSKASAEVKRRAEKFMLYNNLSYHESATRVLQSDNELAELYAFGFVRD